MYDSEYNPVVPDHVPPHLVYDYDPYEQNSRDPFDSVAELFHKDLPEIFWTRHHGGYWIAMGVDAISEVVAGDGTIFSSTRIYTPAHHNSDVPDSLPLQADPPLHTAYRSAVAPLFTPQRVKSLEGGIRTLCRELIAGLKHKKEFDFVKDFAVHLPAIVFLRLMGLPEKDAGFLREMAHQALNPTAYNKTRPEPMKDMYDYLLPYVEERIANPGDDPISHILQQKVGDRSLNISEVVRLSRTILVGGLGTVAATLGFIVRYLAEAPEARRQLIEQPAIIPNAVEEFLRRYPIANVMRFARNDMVFRGVEMKAGDFVQWAIRMYNFDGRHTPDPMEIRFDRPNNRHASFGTRSHHFCIGAPLARLELRIFLEEWLPEIPNFRLKPNAEIGYSDGLIVQLRSLPIELDLAA